MSCRQVLQETARHRCQWSHDVISTICTVSYIINHTEILLVCFAWLIFRFLCRYIFHIFAQIRFSAIVLYFSMDSGWGVVVCARLLAKLEFSRRCWVYCVPLLVWQVSEAGSCLTVSSLVLWRLMELWLNLPTIINNQGGTASSQQGSTPHTFSPLLTHSVR